MSKAEEKPGNDPEFEALLDYIHGSRGFDFTGYKRPSLMRRVNKRMQEVGIREYGNYVDYMEVHPEEFRALFDTILINVTAFFRDASAWELLSQEIIPRILASKTEGSPIRVWCAGCASGEEAYSLAMVLAEALGVDAFRDRVKIYATDVDEEALIKARQAIYDAKELQNVSPTLVEKYFEPFNHRCVFHKELRRSVIFGRHDLIQDAPISRVDLLTCRNTLMYFNTETQARILDRFHFALNEGGVLLLGKSETLLTYSNNDFDPIDLKQRFFARASRGEHRDRLVAMPRLGREVPVNHIVNHFRLCDAAFESGVTAQLLVNSAGLLTLANERARAMFNLMLSDLGRPFKDLQISYRPADLRSCIDRAHAERRAVILNEVEWKDTDDDPSPSLPSF
jgi:two-component system CheB/CheR fusion protein